jgi:hypothetical protein
MPFFVFLNGHHEEEHILLVLVIMQHVLMRKLMVQFFEIDDELLLELDIAAI